jgi:TFIIH basal transcription factor complex TTD-A subunit
MRVKRASPSSARRSSVDVASRVVVSRVADGSAHFHSEGCLRLSDLNGIQRAREHHTLNILNRSRIDRSTHAARRDDAAHADADTADARADAPTRTPVMVSAVHGVVITADVPLKQYILHLNDLAPAEGKFVIADLDDRRVLVQPARVEAIRAEIERYQQSTQYVAPTTMTKQ